ncbi:EpsG family protein [Peribacillus simplex]|uniref:EpsG family protein n=1 Tax=Peribacillus simplex TaxID=1478 RepID=UPI003D27FF2B
MEIYIILYCLLIYVGLYTDDEFISLNKKKILSPKLFLLIFSIILYLISATRFDIGTDYDLYQGIFYDGTEGLLGLGWGFQWISDLFRFLGLDYQYFIAFNSLIFIIAVTYFIYTFSEYKYISLITLLGTYSYFSSFNGFRQFSSISIVLISLILFFHRKKRVYAFILFIISLGLHRSSLMFLPLFFINYIPVKKKMFLSVMFISLISLFLVPESIKNLLFDKILNANSFFEDKYAGTIHAEGVERGITNKMFYLFYWIMTFRVILNKFKTNEKVNWLDKVFLLYFIVNSFLPYSNLVKRISYLLELMALYMIPKFISSNNSKLIRNVLKVSIIIIFLIRLVYVLNQNGDGVVPYDSIIRMF